MDKTWLQGSSWLMPPIAFSSAGSCAPQEMLSGLCLHLRLDFQGLGTQFPAIGFCLGALIRS